MGNHAAGAAVVATALALLDQRDRTGQSALEILDVACAPCAKRPDQPFGCDIEFDGADWPWERFGDLLAEAFAPDADQRLAADEALWWHRVQAPFRKRYGFC